MNTKLIAKVTLDGQLYIPPEILKQLEPLTEYEKVNIHVYQTRIMDIVLQKLKIC